MRNLFFGLVLVNLAFAAWTAWYAEPPPAGSTPREAGLPIRLVGEAAPDSGEADAAPVALVADGAAAAASGIASGGLSGLAGALLPGDADAGEPDADAVIVVEPEASPAPAVAAAAANVGSATAVPESDAGASLAAADPPAPAGGAGTAADRCISVGPFPAAERADAASAALDSAGFAHALRSGDGEIWVGFWVHIDAIPTRDEASAMLARLRENGLEDAYLIPGEEDGDIISLGVFNDMTRAGRLEEQVRDIGLVPLIVERTRTGLVHWLDVTVPGGRDLDLAALGIRQARIEQVPCPDAG